jgi:hypothetical protein
MYGVNEVQSLVDNPPSTQGDTLTQIMMDKPVQKNKKKMSKFNNINLH